MASFNCRISPRTSTVILRDKSPLATAVATSAMFRTWPVRLLAIEFTESVRSFHVPATSGHLRLSAQFAFGSDFAGHARHFSGEHAQLLNHRVDDVGGAQELAFQRTSIHIQPHALRKIALRHGSDGARHLSRRPQQVFDQRVDGNFHLAPRALGLVKTGALARHALFSHDLSDALEFLRHVLVGGHDVVECIGDFACEPHPRAGQAHGEIAIPHALQTGQDRQ